MNFDIDKHLDKLEALYRKMNVGDTRLQDHKKFHIFLCHAESQSYITKQVFYFLDRIGYKVIVDERDFLAGRCHIDNIISAITNSMMVVFLMSEDFTRSEWCEFELKHVYKDYISGCIACRPFIIRLDNADFPLIKHLPSVYFKDSWIVQLSQELIQLTGPLPTPHIPPSILCEDDQGINLYKHLVEHGTERRHYIRIVVVGQDGVGKTCLVKRLLGKNEPFTHSTEGVDISISHCSIDEEEEGLWNFLEGRDIFDGNKRLIETLLQMPRYVTLKNRIVKQKMQGSNTIQNVMSRVKSSVKNIVSSKDQLSNTKAWKEDLKQVCLSVDDTNPKKTVHISIWDFAGHIEYYPTHQLFLSKDSIAILVVDVTKDINDTSGVRNNSVHSIDLTETPISDAGGYVQFWSSSIHCYGNSYHSLDGSIYPPIIPVATHIDKVQGCLEDHTEDYTTKLDQALGKDESRRHFRKLFTVSNKDPSDAAFSRLRQYICKIAKEQPNWGIEVPLRWIPLEKKLNEIREGGLNIISYTALFDINKTLLVSVSTLQEYHMFLKLQHDMGNIIFFEDITEFIILSPQWFVNALRCIVGARCFKSDNLQYYWDQYETTGCLDYCLIIKLFKEKGKDLYEHEEHLLNVMEKYDIVVRADEAVLNPSYFVPCMVRASGLDTLSAKSVVYRKSPILCFEYDFLPPMFFCHIIVYFLRRYKASKEKQNNLLELYRGMALFDIDDSGSEKVMLCKYKNVIQAQIWNSGSARNDTGRMIRCHLEDDLFVIQKKYDVIRSCVVNVKCPEGSYDNNIGMIQINSLLTLQKFFCHEHGLEHHCSEYKYFWLQNNEHQESIITQEELNFIRVTKASVELLTDILYDLAQKTSCPGLRQRADSDITYLYQVLRQQNLPHHRPSNSRWGGNIWPNEATEVLIGDDIERIRLNRNRLQHTAHFEMFDTEFNDRWSKIRNLVLRFDVRLSPPSLYENRLLNIKQTVVGKLDFNFKQTPFLSANRMIPTRRCKTIP